MSNPSCFVGSVLASVGIAGGPLDGQPVPALPRTGRPTFGAEPGSGTGQSAEFGQFLRVMRARMRPEAAGLPTTTAPRTGVAPRGDCPACGGQYRLLQASGTRTPDPAFPGRRRRGRPSPAAGCHGARAYVGSAAQLPIIVEVTGPGTTGPPWPMAVAGRHRRYPGPGAGTPNRRVVQQPHGGSALHCVL